MPAITLPDHSVRRFDGPVTGTEVAEAIGPGLARAALLMKLEGRLVDLATEIDHDAAVVVYAERAPRPARSPDAYKKHWHAQQRDLNRPQQQRHDDQGEVVMCEPSDMDVRPAHCQAGSASCGHW